jgi:hypothetical protein
MPYPLEKPPSVVPPYPPLGGTPYRVTSLDSWITVAQKAGIAPRDLIQYNFGTTNPREVNWCLRNIVGCHHPSPDGWNYMFTSMDNPGVIYLPPKQTSPVSQAPAPIPKASAATHIAGPSGLGPVSHGDDNPPEYVVSKQWKFAPIANFSVGIVYKVIGGGVWLFIFYNVETKEKFPVLFLGPGLVVSPKLADGSIKLSSVKKISDGLKPFLWDLVGKVKFRAMDIMDAFNGDFRPLHVLREFSAADLCLANGSLASLSAGIGIVGLSLGMMEAHPTSWMDRLALFNPAFGAAAMADKIMHGNLTPYFLQLPSHGQIRALELMVSPAAVAAEIGAELATKGKSSTWEEIKGDAKEVWRTVSHPQASIKNFEISAGLNIIGGVWVPLTPNWGIIGKALMR